MSCYISIFFALLSLLSRSCAQGRESYNESQLDSEHACVDNPDGMITDICSKNIEEDTGGLMFNGRDIDGVEEDAIFSEAQQKLLQRTKTEDEDTLQGRVVIETADTDILDLWPPKERIPYEIHTSIESDGRKAIAAAIEDIERLTCVRFKKRKNKETDEFFLLFFKGNGCWSLVGKRTDKADSGQKISIGDGCENKGEVLHLIMHAFGFLNEHTREDRDIYVQINWENIMPDKKKHFRISKQFVQRFLKSSYDYSSIMHYGRKKFSKNGKDTISIFGCSEKAKKTLDVIGQRKGLSAGDRFQINRLFKCKDSSQRQTIIDDSLEDNKSKPLASNQHAFTCNVD